MAKMYVRHRVADFKNWKTIFDSMQMLRKQFGCTGENVFIHHSEPNELLIITDWPTKDQAMKYGQSGELKAGMQKAGVMNTPEIKFAE